MRMENAHNTLRIHRGIIQRYCIAGRYTYSMPESDAVEMEQRVGNLSTREGWMTKKPGDVQQHVVEYTCGYWHCPTDCMLSLMPTSKHTEVEVKCTIHVTLRCDAIVLPIKKWLLYKSTDMSGDYAWKNNSLADRQTEWRLTLPGNSW